MATTVRAMTWNLESHANADFHPGSVANVMNNQDPDIMGLQEVCWATMEDLVKRLRNAGWAKRGHGSGKVWRYHGATIPRVNCPKTGVSAFGNAIMSRLPLGGMTTYVLPFWHEKRLIMRVDVGDLPAPVQAYCMHLSPGSLEHRVDQLTPAVEFAAPGNERKIVFGDFNYKPGNVTVKQTFYEAFAEVDPDKHRPTHGDAKIDYVFVSKNRFRISQADVPNSGAASDHLPLWADLELT